MSRSYGLLEVTSGSWQPLPGDLVWLTGHSVRGQWPPDGTRQFPQFGALEEQQLSVLVPMLIVNVEQLVTGSERMTVFHANRFWWVPRVTVKL